MATSATFTIVKYRKLGKKIVITGTLDELMEEFGYTLECGHDYNSRIPLAPKTAELLVAALNKCVMELQSGSYYPDSYELGE